MITASCGHTISLEWHSNPKSFVEYKDYEDGQPVIVYSVMCKKCREKYRHLIAKTDQEKEEWLTKKK